VDGRTVGAFLRQEVTDPLRADFFIGVPESEDARAATVLPPPPVTEPTIWDTILADPESMVGRTFLNPPRSADLVNTRAWRAAEVPAANGHTSARGVARVYAALARGGELDGVRLLAPATIERAIAEQSSGRDAILALPTRFGTGFMLGTRGGLFDCGPGRRTFGHPGRGGSIGFADPDARLAFGYVTNQYVTGTVHHPDRRVVDPGGRDVPSAGMSPAPRLTARDCLPRDASDALLVGPRVAARESGPAVVAVRGEEVVDLTRRYPTTSRLLNEARPPRCGPR
jgi:CubicO group peptidase (beta-lactamase class C family)